MLNELMGRKVKIVYKHGQNINAIRGVLISCDNNLVRLKTNIGADFYVSISSIQRINEILKDDY